MARKLPLQLAMRCWIEVVALAGAVLLGCGSKTFGPNAVSEDVGGAASGQESAGGSGAQPAAESGAQPAAESGGKAGGEPEAPQGEGERFATLWLSGVVEQGGTFVAVGAKGTGQRFADGTSSVNAAEMFEAIFASSDGRKWQRVHSGPLGSISRVAAGNGHYLALSTEGSSPYWTKAYTSDDGFAWTQASVPQAHIREVVFGNGIFIANDAQERQVYISSDARGWDTVEIPADGTLLPAFDRLAFGAGHFVATRSNKIYTSNDGEQWTLTNYDGPSISDLHGALDRFVVEDKDDCCFGEVPERIEFGIATSSDGLTWEQRSLQGPEVFPLWQGDAGCVGFRVAPREGSDLVGDPTCSRDAARLGPYLDLAVRRAPPLLVNVSVSSTGDILQTSSDGLAWTTVLTGD